MNKFTKLQTALGWTNEQTADNICRSVRTVYKYRSGELKAPKAVTDVLAELLSERELEAQRFQSDKMYATVAIVVGILVILAIIA
jgi:hypothetical protein